LKYFVGKTLKISASKVVLGVIALGIGGFLILGGWGGYSDYMSTRDFSGLALGKVAGKHFQRGSDGNTLYYVDYRFTPAGGNEITATGEIFKQSWDILKDGDSLQIRYDPADSQRNFPAGTGGASIIYAVFIFVLGMVFLVFGVSNLMVGFKWRRSVR